MKFIGKFVSLFDAIFKKDVTLDGVETGTIASGGNLGLDSNNKIVKANAPTSHDAVTLAGTPDYITISGQEITTTQIDLANDVTGTLAAGNVATLNQDTTGNAATATNLVASTSTAVQLGTIEMGHASDTTIARSAAGKATIEGREITTNGSSGTNYISWSTNGYVGTSVQDELHIGNSLYGNYHFNWQTVSVPRTSGTITKNELNCGWLIPVDLAKVEVYVNVRVNAASQNIVTRAFKTASNLTSTTSVTYLGSEATVTGITQASFQDVGPITDIGSVSKGEMLYVGVACTNGTPQMRFNITVFGYIA